MKKRALRKDFFMEIRKSLNRFISIFFIVALGVAFYSGIQASAPDMRYTGDALLAEQVYVAFDMPLDVQVDEIVKKEIRYKTNVIF